ncbi:hypothetical protein L9F63_027524, partial [Diploptera punctata]
LSSHSPFVFAGVSYFGTMTTWLTSHTQCSCWFILPFLNLGQQHFHFNLKPGNRIKSMQ